MNTALFTIFTERIFSQSDFAYRISIVREFLEFVFFTKHDARVSGNSIDQFVDYSKKSVADVAFLRALPESFFESFTQASLYETLDNLSKEAKQLKTLSLTTPVALSSADVNAIGMWARHDVDPPLLIEINVDPVVAVGCRAAWHNHLYDFGFDHYLAKTRAALQARVAERMTAGAAVS